jgi:hypothetical protein
MKDPQFPELLNLLMEIRSLKVDNVKISLGRLQNLMSSACVEHLDFSNSVNVAELDIEPFTQLQHPPQGNCSLIEIPKQIIKTEEIRDFVVIYILTFKPVLTREPYTRGRFGCHLFCSVINCTDSVHTVSRAFLLFERSGGGNCEAISDGAERVLNFSILYTHPHTLF